MGEVMDKKEELRKLLSEKRVFEGVLTRFDGGWIIPEVNIGREDVIEMLEEFEGKAVRITIEPLPIAPQPATPAPEHQPHWREDWPKCHCFHQVCCGLTNRRDWAEKCEQCKWRCNRQAPGPSTDG